MLELSDDGCIEGWWSNICDAFCHVFKSTFLCCSDVVVLEENRKKLLKIIIITYKSKAKEFAWEWCFFFNHFLCLNVFVSFTGKLIIYTNMFSWNFLEFPYICLCKMLSVYYTVDVVISDDWGLVCQRLIYILFFMLYIKVLQFLLCVKKCVDLSQKHFYCLFNMFSRHTFLMAS